jgi:4-amino-4-deoxy-L-arabinose transferase-like glycosyltransferase
LKPSASLAKVDRASPAGLPQGRPTAGQFILMILVALGVRVAIVPFLYHEWMDPFVLEHWAFGRIARSIASGHGFGSPFADTGNSALLPPVYAYVLAGVFKIFGIYTKVSIIAAACLNSLLSALTCLPVYFVARKCFGDRAGLWSAWGWALSPYGIYFSADWLWSTCLFTLLLSLVFLYALAIGSSPRLLTWVGFGALAGLAALTEPVILAVLPALIAVGCYQLYRQRQRWLLPGLVSILALAAVLSPWIVRNYGIFHQFIPVRGGFGLELYLGNSGYSEHWANRSVHPNHNNAELAEYVQTGETAYMAHKRDQALDYIRAHPGWFAWMTGRRILYMWTGYWSFDRKYLTEEPLDPPNVFVATTLTALALGGIYRAYRDKPIAAARFALVFLCFPVAYYISHPEAYYLRPLDPLINILAMYAILGCRDARTARLQSLK